MPQASFVSRRCFTYTFEFPTGGDGLRPGPGATPKMSPSTQRTLTFQHDAGIVLSADVGELSEIRAVAALARESGQVVALKVGVSTVLRFGLPAVANAVRAETDVPIIYDHQKAGTDIPRLGRLFAAACAEAEVTALIIFPHAGPLTLRGFVEAAQEAGLVPIVGLVMSHKSYLQSEGGYISNEAPERICEDSLALGVRDFVLPGTKPEIVRRFADGPFSNLDVSILMPGIGSQGGDLPSALAAAAPHRAYGIIGSAIYSAPDPALALGEFSRAFQ